MKVSEQLLEKVLDQIKPTEVRELFRQLHDELMEEMRVRIDTQAAEIRRLQNELSQERSKKLFRDITPKNPHPHFPYPPSQPYRLGPTDRPHTTIFATGRRLGSEIEQIVSNFQEDCQNGG